MADSGAVEHTAGWESVALYGGEGPDWRPVSPRLVAARSVAATIGFGGVLGVTTLGALAIWAPLGWAAPVIGLAYLWTLWLIRRQVSAISWAEQEEELVIRKGRLWRSLVSVPYGRLQLADMESGPISRRFGLASVQLHTAAPRTGARIPGLPVNQAQALRARLTERGESQRAGL
jgi:membrane protein YdbS with pleckstrin-like domain